MQQLRLQLVSTAHASVGYTWPPFTTLAPGPGPPRGTATLRSAPGACSCSVLTASSRHNLSRPASSPSALAPREILQITSKDLSTFPGAPRGSPLVSPKTQTALEPPACVPFPPPAHPSPHETRTDTRSKAKRSATGDIDSVRHGARAFRGRSQSNRARCGGAARQNSRKLLTACSPAYRPRRARCCCNVHERLKLRIAKPVALPYQVLSLKPRFKSPSISRAVYPPKFFGGGVSTGRWVGRIACRSRTLRRLQLATCTGGVPATSPFRSFSSMLWLSMSTLSTPSPARSSSELIS
ncbi:hypothetical protein FKP32DRAFT_818424 [Trametes sanguinea]|nr:hypothetical protein FKP32DRAFT_818424 [Trametes sanguinea]